MKPENLILVVCGGLVLLALIIIPWGGMKKPANVKGDSSNDQPPLFMSVGGTNTSSFLNTNEPCTYVIYIDNNNVTNAKNCSNGNIDYSNSNPYTTIEKAINSPTITNIAKHRIGGEIYVKSGVYSLNHRIDLNVSGIKLIGENEISVFQSGQRNYPTVFKMANGTNLGQMIFVNSGVQLFGDTLSSFYVDCNVLDTTASTNGVLIQTVADFQMENVAVNFCKGSGVFVQDSIAGFFKDIHAESGQQGFVFLGTSGGGGLIGNRLVGLYADNANNSTSYTIDGFVQGNTFSSNIGREDKGRCFYMFYDNGNAPNKPPSKNTFVGNECMYITTSGNGLYGFDLLGAQNNTFTGNLVFNWGQSAQNTYDGFFLHATGGVNSIYNTFIGNNVVSSAVTNHMRYGFNENDVNQNFNSYIGNNIAGMNTSPIRTQGNQSRAVDNIGYNPVASSTVTAGASVWTYTDKDGYMEQMILSTLGGQTAETCHGITTLLPTTLGTECTLDIGQSLTSTWATTAPVYTKVPLD